MLRCSSAGWTQSAGQRAARLGGHDEGGGGAAVTTDQDDDAAASWVAHRTGAGTPTGCCWEERELGGYGVTQRCGAPVVTGRPWCARHLRRYLAGKKLAGAPFTRLASLTTESNNQTGGRSAALNAALSGTKQPLP